MTTVLKRTVLLGTVVLAGMMATYHDFSAPTHPDSYQPSLPIATSGQTYALYMQKPAGDVSIRIPRRLALINTTLAELQEGIFGNSIAEDLKLPSREFLAIP